MKPKSKILADACTAGDGDSCYELGYMCQIGRGVEQNYYKAIKFFKKACDLKHEDGCEYYAILTK